MHARYNLPGLGNELFELLAGADVQLLKAVEELRKVFNNAVAEDLGFAVLVPGQSLGEVRHQPRKLFGKG